jgi:hypothetical protein
MKKTICDLLYFSLFPSKPPGFPASYPCFFESCLPRLLCGIRRLFLWGGISLCEPIEGGNPPGSWSFQLCLPVKFFEKDSAAYLTGELFTLSVYLVFIQHRESSIQKPENCFSTSQHNCLNLSAFNNNF